MVLAGEDPHYIFRRMLILASEDVGMADPQALRFVESAAAAFDRVGMPEGRFHLAHATLYLATAPKSNSSLGFFDALSLLESEQREGEIPNHLRDASRDKDGFGHGEGYMYPHAFRDHWVAQQYLPAALQGKVFYSPSDQGREAAIREEVLRRREIQIATALEPPSLEVLTFTSAGTSSARWIERLSAGRRAALSSLRDRLFAPLAVQRHSRILDADARTGLLLWEALRRAPEGGVWGIVATRDEAALLQHRMKDLEQAVRPVILQPDRPLVEMARALSSLPPDQAMTALGVDPAIRFDFIVGRDLFTRLPASDRAALLGLLLALLAPGGVLSFAQVIPKLGQRLSALVVPGGTEIERKLEAAEACAYSESSNDLVNWDHADLAAACREAGALEVSVETERSVDSRRVSERELELWLAPDSAYGRALAAAFVPEELAQVREAFRAQLVGREVPWTSTVAYVLARRSAENDPGSQRP
jgi:putative ATPase